ncbi:MAG: MBL fold metallo-hydrolase [Thermoleophilia bacterium]
MSVHWLNGTTGYLPGAVNVGVVRLDGETVLLIDSGLDEDRARKVLNALEREGLRPAVLFLTHAHADHMGGARFLKRRTGVQIIAPSGEADFIRRPYLEPFALYGLADPPSELRSKFLMAESVEVDVETDEGPWSPVPDGPSLTVIGLAGHSPWQCGLTLGGVCFCGDALFPAQLWDKHGFIYHADISRCFSTFDRLAELAPDILVPAHGEPAEPGDGLIETNRRQLKAASDEVLDAVRETARTRAGTEDILAVLADRWGVDFRGLIDFSLARATLNAHLVYLEQAGAVKCRGEGGHLLWLPV